MRPTVHSETIRLIVAEYEATDPQRSAEVEWWEGDGLSFNALIDRVGQADLDGKRHPHQRRLTAAALGAGTAALHGLSDQMQAARDFHTLWQMIEDAFKPIYGLGELAAYDAAERLRYRLGLESEHLTYLHAGARVGARRLAGGRLKRDDAWGILRWGVPNEMRHLCTHEIEDVLCIYKDELLLTPQEFRARRSSGGRGGCSRPLEHRPHC